MEAFDGVHSAAVTKVFQSVIRRSKRLGPPKTIKPHQAGSSLVVGWNMLTLEWYCGKVSALKTATFKRVQSFSLCRIPGKSPSESENTLSKSFGVPGIHLSICGEYSTIIGMDWQNSGTFSATVSGRRGGSREWPVPIGSDNTSVRRMKLHCCGG